MEIVNYKSDYGIENKNDIAYVSSLYVAQYFDKKHQHVMESIRKILDTNSGYSEEFGRSNFRRTSYSDSQGKKRPCYLLTRDGFTTLKGGDNNGD